MILEGLAENVQLGGRLAVVVVWDVRVEVIVEVSVVDGVTVIKTGIVDVVTD